jgi:hypothetical protein
MIDVFSMAQTILGFLTTKFALIELIYLVLIHANNLIHFSMLRNFGQS